MRIIDGWDPTEDRYLVGKLVEKGWRVGSVRMRNDLGIVVGNLMPLIQKAFSP